MFPALLILGACGRAPAPDDKNCAERTAWYPDDDGDGIGEPTTVYIGCTAPAGWVTAVGEPIFLEIPRSTRSIPATSGTPPGSGPTAGVRPAA